MRVHRLEQCGNALRCAGDRLHNLSPARVLVVRPEFLRGSDLALQTIRAGQIGFVNRKDISDFHDPRFESLHRIAARWGQHDDRAIGDPCNVDLGLTDADGLQKNDVEAKQLERGERTHDRPRQTAQRPPCRHAAQVHAAVRVMSPHANAVA